MNTQLDNITLAGRVTGNATDSDDYVNRCSIMEDERVAFQLSLRLLEELRLRNQDEAKRITKKEQDQSAKIIFGSNNSGFQIEVSNGSISGITFGSRGS